VEHGRNGFLAETVDDFVASLLQLAKSKDLRRRLGAAARKTVEERYSAEVVAARFAEVVRFVTDGALRPQATQ